MHLAGWENYNAAVADDYRDVLSLVSRGRLALLLGVEGGNAPGRKIPTVLVLLQTFCALGARYMTITSFTDNGRAMPP